MLCGILLICSLAVIASAEIVPSDVTLEGGYNLGEYGQLAFVLDKRATLAPEIDGVIGDGEYSLEMADLVMANDRSDDRFFIVDTVKGLESVDLFMSYDEEYLYLAARVTDNDIVPADRIVIKIGCDPQNIGSQISIGGNHGMLMSEYTEDVATGVVGNVITYEFAVRRVTLADYAGFDELQETIYIQPVIASTTSSGVYGEVWVGFVTSGSAPLVASHPIRFNRYPHVLRLADDSPVETEPVTEPVTEAPVEEKGCGAALASSVLVLLTSLVSLTAVSIKKRK